MRQHRERHGHRGDHRGRFAEGERGERSGRRRRVFDANELRLVLLKLIEEQPRHGYDLIREVEARAGGAYAPSPGVVYPLTTMMLDMGLVEQVDAEGARKLFTIAQAGRDHLAEQAEDLDRAMARLQALADVRERTDAAPVRRAMHNLKTALHDRLSQENVERALILDVAALIDRAAADIERL